MAEKDITVQGVEQGFSHLKEALKSAVSQSSKNGGQCIINIPKGIHKLTSAFNVTGDIKLQGEKGSVVVLEVPAALTVKKGSLSLSNLAVSSGNRTAKEGFCLNVLAKASLVIENCEFDPEQESVEIPGFQINGGFKAFGCTFNKWTVEASDKSVLDLNKCAFNASGSSETSPAINLCAGSNCSLSETNFSNVSYAVIAVKATKIDLNACEIKNPKKTAIIAKGSKGSMRDLKIICEAEDKATGIVLDGKSVFDIKDLSIENMGNTAFVCEAESVANIVGFSAKANCNGVLSISNAEVTGRKFNFVENEGTNVTVTGEKSIFHLKEADINGGSVGFRVEKNEDVEISMAKVIGVTEAGFSFEDCSVLVNSCHVNNKKTKAAGMKVVFDTSKREKIVFNECKNQNCSKGIEVFQKIVKQHKEPMDDLAVPVDNYSHKDQALSKCELNNCSFIACKIGFSVDGAKAVLSGCSFIMNTKHSIFMKNEGLSAGGDEIRKRSKLKIR